MRAAPRGVAANIRSRATIRGRRSEMTSSARSASASENARISSLPAGVRSFSDGNRSGAPMTTAHASATAASIQFARDEPSGLSRPHRRSTAHPPCLRPAGPRGLVYADGPRFTFAELEQEARTVARGLMAAGVERGERVVLWATNVPEWVVLQFALAKIGAILVTANTSLRSKDIDYLLRQSEAATLITIRGFRDLDYLAALAEIG